MTLHGLHCQAKAPDADANPPSIGFTDERPIRNDLDGALQGMVEFAQSHTIAPNGNAALSLPNLVTSRDALLIWTPSTPIDAAESVMVERIMHGVSTREFQRMRPPAAFPDSDAVALGDRPNVLYSTRAWSALLPARWMSAGISLRIQLSNGLSGVLPSERMEWSGAPHVVLHNIRIGMLSDPPNNVNNLMERDPGRFAIDYYSKIPISKLTLTQYLPVRFPRIVLPDGKVYTTASETDGGTHIGDMREYVGKQLVSKGIDLANYGIHSSMGGSADWIHYFPQVTVHQSQGQYANGLQLHGYSGGNGMATLFAVLGNEFSHELGHNWSLGDYPGMSTHFAGSGWGYDAFLDRMIANLDWAEAPATNEQTLASGKSFQAPPFKGMYRYGWDAMAGGRPMGSVSALTHHIGYSARAIQNYLNALPSLDPGSSSGLTLWDASTQSMRPFLTGRFFKPVKSGVPVVTLVGFYDPEARNPSMIYPPLHGNWGNVFAHSNTQPSDGCWLAVTGDAGNVYVELASERLWWTYSNKFHVNVDAGIRPRLAEIRCKRHVLDRAALPAATQTLRAPITVGGELGFEQAAMRLHSLEEKFAGTRFRLWKDFAQAMRNYYGPIRSWVDRASAPGGTLHHGSCHSMYMLLDQKGWYYPEPVGSSDSHWRYLGDPMRFIDTGIEPLRARKLSDGGIDERIAAYYGVPNIKQWVLGDTTGRPGDIYDHGDALFMLCTDRYHYFPIAENSNRYWVRLPSKKEFEKVIKKVKESREAFEAQILTWYGQDRFPEWEQHVGGKPGTLYRYDYGGKVRYFRLKTKNYWYFPTGDYSNSWWEFIDRW